MTKAAVRDPIVVTEDAAELVAQGRVAPERERRVLPASRRSIRGRSRRRDRSAARRRVACDRAWFEPRLRGANCAARASAIGHGAFEFQPETSQRIQ